MKLEYSTTLRCIIEWLQHRHLIIYNTPSMTIHELLSHSVSVSARRFISLRMTSTPSLWLRQKLLPLWIGAPRQERTVDGEEVVEAGGLLCFRINRLYTSSHSTTKLIYHRPQQINQQKNLCFRPFLRMPCHPV